MTWKIIVIWSLIIYPPPRIFVVDYLHNLGNYYMPQNLVEQGITWDGVAQAIEATPL